MGRKTKKAEQDNEDNGPHKPVESTDVSDASVVSDDFVARIVRDPSQPPQLQLLSGYLGASSEEGCVWLYLDEELGRYVEIPVKAIRHTRELPPEQSPLGGSLVWVERGAAVSFPDREPPTRFCG